MNVLSLFDGMSCGRIALEKAGILIDKYYACEIDKYAVKVSKANYPDTFQLGDVKDLTWNDSALHAHLRPKIDLLIGGSPCQGFSFAGKHLDFDDPRSKLFFEFVRLMDETKPRWFLLENVRMKEESQDIISRYMGVQPQEINSNLVSAQNRKRLYWTNIPFTMPEDRGIMLKDIIEDGLTDRDKAHCLDANYFKGGNLSSLKNYFEKSRRQLVFSREPKVLIVQRPRGKNKFGYRALNGKTPTLSSNSWEQNNFLVNPETLKWRRLTPLECERLQTVPEGYTAHVSNTQRYKMLGNGWTVDVVAHIFKNLGA
jgi:DNA-cytosine methyltransferase